MNTSHFRRLLLGNPLATAQAGHERISKRKALAVFSSDALSSVAYATEEILLVLVLAGVGATFLSWPIALTIAALLAIVATSYYQTVHAYPNGGGSYIVAHDNLGEIPGLVAAAALLIDYILTVSVSTSAAVAAITSAIPVLHEYRVMMGIVLIAIITLMNLRGLQESATVFAYPTYMFIISFLIMIAAGLYQWLAAGMPAPLPPEMHAETQVFQVLTLFLILRAFSSGCTAMTGVEAISNSVPAFKPPESDNAGKTLAIMAGLLITMFLGITFLARQFGVTPDEATPETVVSQLARHIFGSNTIFYFVIQGVTALILSLAANTSFAGFPRLAFVLATDRYLPRQLSNLGDKLVYSNGIILLGLVASILLAAFGGITTRLIPLYTVGVFVSFTLSQAGMVIRWRRLKGPHWKLKTVINGVGAIATGVVMVVVVTSKFMLGAWAVVLAIPFFVLAFKANRTHYYHMSRQLSLKNWRRPLRVKRHRAIIPISGVHHGVMNALRYARSISDDVTAVYVEVDPESTPIIEEMWQTWGDGVRLVILPSPYRSLIEPLLAYVNSISDASATDEVVTIVLPQFVPAKWWHNFLHNQSILFIRMAFLRRSNTIVTDVPYRLTE